MPTQLHDTGELAPSLQTAPVSHRQIQSGQDHHLPGLDVLRGIAVLGLLLASIRSFGLTQAQVSQLIRGPHGGNYWLLVGTHVLVDDTMRALFAMGFGAGILLYLAKPAPSGNLARPELFIRRQLWLAVFGIVNAIVLLSPVDFLFQYGILGVLLFPMQRLSARAFLIGAIVTGLLFSGKNYWNYTEQQAKYTKFQAVTSLEKKNKKVKLTDEQKADKSGWEGMVKSQAYDEKKDKAAIVSMRSDYGTVWEYMLLTLQRQQSGQFYRLSIWDFASMMLLGMALFRWGFFSNRLTIGQYAGLAAGGLLIGYTLFWLALPSFELKAVDFTKLVSTGQWPLCDLLQPAGQAFAAVGWAGLVMLLHRAGAGTGLWRVMQAVGQLALTNYFLQTVCATLFFYGYGLGYFGDLRLYHLYIVVAELWLIQLVFSVLWLRWFRQGPVEWLLQSLTHGKRQSMRLTESTPILTAYQPQSSL